MTKDNLEHNEDLRFLQKTLADNINLYRARAQLSLSRLSEKAGISRSQLCAVRALKCNPTLGWMLSIAKALEVPIADLVRDYSTDRIGSGKIP